ncbi:hypothetical protein KUF54_16580 [Comamonas sp. Y33R10-2]|uniref:hypothetical protein n=1 Tax=Comamonas sp. Y33R10-2 TaxID=2853257 RepID=UPI001C5CBCA0|nr:hypothetical protein [Comamonas sp. Y33R10-2]QXZ09595.1 hypothetical protein KUF54_16580 [Comamonas sp. Y33R10-2]
MRYQRARLQYQFSKLRFIREGVSLEYGGNVEFELFSFFEICYHLKDWVKNSPECSSFSDVENFIKDTPALRICADICNRLKHKTLTRRRSNSEIGIFQITSTISVSMPEDKSHSMARLDKATIETERGEECCFALAQECMNEWNQYFQRNGV